MIHVPHSTNLGDIGSSLDADKTEILKFTAHHTTGGHIGGTYMELSWFGFISLLLLPVMKWPDVRAYIDEERKY